MKCILNISERKEGIHLYVEGRITHPLYYHAPGLSSAPIKRIFWVGMMHLFVVLSTRMLQVFPLYLYNADLISSMVHCHLIHCLKKDIYIYLFCHYRPTDHW